MICTLRILRQQWNCSSCMMHTMPYFREKNLIAYADQELLIMDLIKRNPYYFEDFGYRHIMVDEYQDSSPMQFELLKILIDSPSFESFMVVGDDSQSIFSFQGSGIQRI